MPGLEMPRVGAVVVNLDGGALLWECLSALEGQGLSEIVVVDNGSSEEEIARLAKRSDLSLVRLPKNEGFAGPANRGADALAASANPPAYVVFVNNDCVLSPVYVSACVETMERDPALAAVQGAVLDAKGERVDGLGLGWNGRGEAVQIGWGGPPPPESAAPFPVAGVSGTAPVFRLATFREIGGFEPSFFAYYEDADLSLRLARRGARFACVPAARARHAGSATGRRRPDLMWRRLFANRIRTLRRNVETSGRHPALVPSALRAAASDLGWARAAGAALSAFREVLRARRGDAGVLRAHPALARLPQ